MANILFLMTDQQRIDTLGCYGNTSRHTPNLDRLAAREQFLTARTLPLPSAHQPGVPPNGASPVRAWAAVKLRVELRAPGRASRRDTHLCRRACKTGVPARTRRQMACRTRAGPRILRLRRRTPGWCPEHIRSSGIHLMARREGVSLFPYRGPGLHPPEGRIAGAPHRRRHGPANRSDLRSMAGRPDHRQTPRFCAGALR